MAEFKLERFKYAWKGTWQPDTAYKRDDVVRVNGKSYVCVVTHVSSTIFRNDLNAILPGSVPPQPQPRWVVMTSGTSFEGEWTNGTAYNLGDIVLYDGSLWTCVSSHTASNFASDFDNWTIFAQTTSFVGNWTDGNTYAPGAVVKYNGMSYKCENAHTASSTLESNIDDWVVYHNGIEVRNEWASGIEYRLNDLVKYGGTVFRCTETHTSEATGLADEKFEVEVFGSQYDSDWQPSEYYNIGDIVRHGGFMYYAINNNTDSVPYDDNSSPDWILLSRSYKFVGNWGVDTVYKTGEIVLRGGDLYLALRDIGTNETQDGSSVDYLQNDTWELLIPGKSFKGNWTDSTFYNVGDVIYYRSTAYLCNFAHEASIQNFPGDNGNGIEYWDILIQGGSQGGLEQKGDLLTFGPSRQIDNDGSTIFDDSTVGLTRVPIGNNEQLLSVTQDLDLFWRDITEDAESVYVSTNGMDDFERGTFQKPFRTIRYAAEYVEDNFDPLTPVIIRVSTGSFNEIGPIIVPAGCAINGDELRSTTVVANPPFESYQNSYQYVPEYLEYFVNIVGDILIGNPIIPTTGNNETQITSIQEQVTSQIDGLPLFDDDGNPVLREVYPQVDIAGTVNLISLIDDYKNYIEFNIANGEVIPEVTGSNELNSDSNLVNLSEALFINRKFIVAEVYAWLDSQYPNITFNYDETKADIWAVLRGLIRDTKYSGNYGTLFAARRFANAVNGSQRDNIFFMRDTTGLRDLTTRGLEGTLNPPGVFDLYQKPTGGACVSFDPGWGPDDERCWIINRSPYIQGVTNIGTGCVGKRCDGRLHNGGNKSMTSNDFTQVLSDGIGVWVSDNARTELVSVFTYYCQVGYFAEDGGIIRAANGNNSYGNYGTIADGVDDTEIPQVVTVFNRNNEAQVAEAFAGGISDEVILFEYENAGEEYTEALATITGSGANASFEYRDFRDGGLFEARLISPDGSSSEGGSGYLVRQGNAQETLGASSTIKLSANDPTQFLSEIDGMRIIITDGTGVGQYGRVDDFEFSTKTVTVRRESDGELGWDNIVPGTPVATDLNLTTRYRIEPRITVSEPDYSTQAYNLFTNRIYVDLKFGNITESYNNVTGGGNIIWKDDERNFITISQIISPVALQFNAVFASDPLVPFNIKGRTSGAEATVTNISARTDELIEVDIDANGNNFTLDEEIDIVYVSGSGDTFDASPIPAEFDVLREGQTYTVTLSSGGAGYQIGDVITLLGTQLGGTSPENDIRITVDSVSTDSTSSILTFTSSGTGRGGRFVALTSVNFARYSDNGQDWLEVSLPFSADMVSLMSGDNQFIAVASNTDRISASLDGITWTERALPTSANWQDGVYGNNKFVIVANDTPDVLSSADGITWTSGNIPDDAGGNDSTISQWSYITYGKGKFLAVSANDFATATSTDGVTWTRHDEVLPDLSPDPDWVVVDVAFGNNRFVVIDSTGRTAYSFDGITWYNGDTIPDNMGKLDYGQGLFFALLEDTEGNVNTAYTSPDGITWTARTLASSCSWTALTTGKINNSYKWVLIASLETTDAVNHIAVGTPAKCRAEVTTGQFNRIKVWDPGSGYTEDNLPVITVIDPNATTDVAVESRIGNGVLAQPDFVDRGAGYRSSTSTITIIGNGFADIIPTGNEVTVSGVRNIPGPGVQIEFSGILNTDTEIPDDLFIFSGVEVFDLGDDGTGNETRLVKFTVTPSVGVENNLRHGTLASLRELFSQARLSGHDFLDIGTGNFINTNYPEIYAGGNFFTAAPENEVYETNSGRVFYVSTDQDGNFRTGELFAVQQATGIVTISAQFFDLDGLSELALGGVRLGGSGTVVNEFSTDPTFSADSNNIIPTQRAIATFLADRLSVGGENLETNRIVAGRIGVGGSDTVIENVIDGYLKIPVDANFDGTYDSDDGEGNITTSQTGIQGTIVTQILFVKQFDETMQ